MKSETTIEIPQDKRNDYGYWSGRARDLISEIEGKLSALGAELKPCEWEHRRLATIGEDSIDIEVYPISFGYSSGSSCACGLKVKYETVSSAASRWGDGLRRKTLSKEYADAGKFDVDKIAKELVAAVNHKRKVREQRADAYAAREKAAKEQKALDKIAAKEFPNEDYLFSECQRQADGQYKIAFKGTVTLETAKEIRRLLKS